ncbi:hypothetical protein TNCV_2478621 [Trichonephila clavipes]|nr:hypothetical protein TNCV_2478621 [Trichonephila clavipes]
MALYQQSNMELVTQSPYSTSFTETAPLQCEELTSIKVYIRRLQIICREKEKTVSLLRLAMDTAKLTLSINSHGTNSRTSRALSNKLAGMDMKPSRSTIRPPRHFWVTV